MGRAANGLALVVVAIILGVAFFSGNLSGFIEKAQKRILDPSAAKDPLPKVAVSGPGGRSHLS